MLKAPSLNEEFCTHKIIISNSVELFQTQIKALCGRTTSHSLHIAPT